MALTRADTCQHVMVNTVFSRCTLTYNGTCNGKSETWLVRVLASDLPGNTNPTDAQIWAVADPRAQAKYEAWCAVVDPTAQQVTRKTGQSGTVVP